MESLSKKYILHFESFLKKVLLVIFAYRYVVTFHLLPILITLHTILDVKSLEYRRVKFDLILTYKICYHLSDLHFDDYFVFRKYRLQFKAIQSLCPNSTTV